MNQSQFLLPILLAGCLYAFGQYISSEPVRNQGQVLTVQAVGKATSVPGIAHVTLGVHVVPQQTAQVATDMMAQRASAVLTAVKALGVPEADIKTQNVSVQPSYAYDEGEQRLLGFEGNQTIEVTIRKNDHVESPGDLAGDVIAKATEAGANQLGGVRFENENQEVQQFAAEQDAIANARRKADVLAKALDVRLGKVKYYSVQSNYGGPIPYALEERASDVSKVASPPILPGTQEDSVTVTIEYDIR